MSGVEEVVDHPPDDTACIKDTEDKDLPDPSGEKSVPDKDIVPGNTAVNSKQDNTEENLASNNTEEELMEEKDNILEKENVSSGVESDSSSLTDSDHWTIVDKEETEASKEIKSSEEIVEKDDKGSKVEEVKKKEDEKPDSTDVLFQSTIDAPSEKISTSSMVSEISTLSLASDGIPINDDSPISEDGQPQYEWSNMDDRDDQDGSEVPLPPEDENVDNNDEVVDEDIGHINDDEDDERRVPGDDSEPGYDLDDDGLPGAPLAPLNQDVELYPSQELDENFQVIEKGEVYKHYKNLQLDHLLTAILVLSVALVIGLGIGHFLGLSERLEVQEMYEHLQDEKLDHLQDDLVTCIDGEEGRGGDDQDLDDRVIRQLWEENQELRDQVQVMKSNVPYNGEEAMTAILRDKINELITANGELEREVARLRYVEAARGAAEFVETLNELRKTRDTLNDIVTENDKLKIQVVKSRYGGPFPDSTTEEERDNLVLENQILKEKLEKLESSIVPKDDKFDSDLKPIEEHIFYIDKNTNDLMKDGLSTPWPSRRHVELSSDENKDSEHVDTKIPSKHRDEHMSFKTESKKDSEQEKDEDVDDDEEKNTDDEIPNESMNDLSSYLSQLFKSFGTRVVNKEGNIDWDRANRFIDGLKTDVGTKFNEAGKLAKEEINLVVEKFDELKSFVDNEQVKENLMATKTAAKRFVKTLVETVGNLKEATEDAAERSDWYSMFKSEASKVKSGLGRRWDEIKEKWQIITKENNKDDEETIDNTNHDNEKNEGVRYKKGKKRWLGGDQDEGYETSEDKEETKYKSQKYKHSKQRNTRDRKDLSKDEGYHSSEENNEMFNDEAKYKTKKEKDDNTIHNEGDQKYLNKKKRGNHGEKYEREQFDRRLNKESKDDWSMKRGEKRDKLRQEDNSDWMSNRAKHRKDARLEESRGDWYFERRTQRGDDQEYPESERESCHRDDQECYETQYGDNSKNDDFDINKYKQKTKEKRKGEKYKDQQKRESWERKPEEGERNSNAFDNEYDFEGQMHYVQRDENGKTKQYRRSHSRRKYFDDKERDHEFHHFESDFGDSFY